MPGGFLGFLLRRMQPYFYLSIPLPVFEEGGGGGGGDRGGSSSGCGGTYRNHSEDRA